MKKLIFVVFGFLLLASMPEMSTASTVFDDVGYIQIDQSDVTIPEMTAFEVVKIESPNLIDQRVSDGDINRFIELKNSNIMLNPTVLMVFNYNYSSQNKLLYTSDNVSNKNKGLDGELSIKV